VATPLRERIDLANTVMLYLLTVFVVALRLGRGPAVLAAFLAVGLFDFFFVPPRLAFAVEDSGYLITFTVMLVVGLITAQLAARVQRQATLAMARQWRTHRLYELARALTAAAATDELRRALDAYLEPMGYRAELLQPDAHGRLPGLHAHPALATLAQTAIVLGEPVNLASLGEADAPQAFVPVGGGAQALGVLALVPKNRERLKLDEEKDALMTAASLLAVTLQRLHPDGSGI